jgi:hypothetical protein
MQKYSSNIAALVSFLNKHGYLHMDAGNKSTLKPGTDGEDIN